MEGQGPVSTGAASGLAWGDAPLPQLAEAAVRQALARLSAARAAAVLLYLTPDFAREAGAALKAAARAASCLNICGGLAAHPFTEREAVLDRPAAAALVLTALPPGPEGPRLTYSHRHPASPQHWHEAPRFGLECAPGPLWSQGRLQDGHQVDMALGGLAQARDISHGLQYLTPPLDITACDGLRLLQVGHSPALESLRRALPPELRERQPLHTLFALPPGGPGEAVAILESHADGSLTLAAPLPQGSTLCWAARQPLAAEAELNRQLADLARRQPRPWFGLMHACIGRGPWFHGGEDANRAAWHRHFGDLPLLGAYGDGQIIPSPPGGARLVHNSVLTTLCGPAA